MKTPSPVSLAARLVCWINLGFLAAFLINVFLVNVYGWPGANLLFDGAASALQLFLYPLSAVLAAAYVFSSRSLALRDDANRAYRINHAVIRAAFFVVLFIGLVDIALSFGRIEGLTDPLFGDSISRGLGRPQYRGMIFHLPTIAIAIVVSAFVRTAGFYWLSLLIVGAELLIVLSRFIFSYEQAFMSDLVRFWYGALFLFASAYTLTDEGHVRVDVFYASFSTRTKGIVNFVGTMLLGISFCWTIIIVGMGSPRSIINAPVFSFEVTQSASGLYVKYLMAAFLGVFAISMMIQFTGYMMSAVADWRDDSGHVEHEGANVA